MRSVAIATLLVLAAGVLLVDQVRSSHPARARQAVNHAVVDPMAADPRVVRVAALAATGRPRRRSWNASTRITTANCPPMRSRPLPPVC